MTRLGTPATRSSTAPEPDVCTGTPGNARPSSSAVRRAPTTEDRSWCPPQREHSKPPIPLPHQRQAGAAPGAGKRQRAVAVRAPGRARGRSGRTATGGSRAAGPAPGPARGPAPPWPCATPATAGARSRRQGRARARSPPPRRALWARWHGPWCGPPRSGLSSPDSTQRLDRRRPRETAGEQGRPLEPGTSREHLADVGVGRAGLLVQVVAVVPPGEQPEVADRREASGAGAHDHLHVPAQHLEPGGVARLRSLVGREPDVPAGPEDLGEGGVDPRDVAVVGHDDDRSPAAVQRRAGRLGQGSGPVARRIARGQRQPGGCGGSAARDVGQEVAAGGIAVPGGGGRHGRQVRPLGWCHGQRLLSGGVPRRDGEAQHVAERAGIPLGGGPRSGQDGGREHRLGRDDPAQRRQPALVLGVGLALEDEAVEVLARRSAP